MERLHCPTTPLEHKSCLLHVLHITTAADRAKPSIRLSIAKVRPLSQPHVSPFHLQIFNDLYQGQQRCYVNHRVCLGNYRSQIPSQNIKSCFEISLIRSPNNEKGALLPVLSITESMFVAAFGATGSPVWVCWIISLIAVARRVWNCHKRKEKISAWNRKWLTYLNWDVCQKVGIQERTKWIPGVIT